MAALRDDAWLELTVVDNGCACIPHPASNSTSNTGSGFGLQQIRERLATGYGDQATFKLIAASAGGSASPIFPFKIEP